MTIDPETAKIWFKDRRGCFEKPSLDRAPEKVSIPKLEVYIALSLYIIFGPTFIASKAPQLVVNSRF